ncbi:hypothetical protein SUGI_0576510 [Cryptomeria japonica]|nr:hypothetical protein SUGI_0576510 [Cryptomeria japonica]
MSCFPSLPNKADFQRLQEEVKSALPSITSLSSISHWHLPEVLANCLPESLSHANRTEQCVLQKMKQDFASMIASYLQQPITRWPFFVFLGVFQNPEFRTFRASLFFGMGVSGIAPILHKLILYKDEPAALYTTAYEVAMGVFYGLGALVYALRIPEKWKPGKFDIAGNSHQLFHVLVVIAAYTHYRAGLIYLQWRDAKGC